jgi:hypothetical protein
MLATESTDCYLCLCFFITLDIFVDWQDISQPKSEANPPDGVLAVPLLRHQVCAGDNVVLFPKKIL